MDREHMLERLLPERYVAGRLSADEAAEFEAQMLADPELLEYVEAARELRLGLRTLADRGQLPRASRARHSNLWWLMAACVTAFSIAFILLRQPDSSMLAASLGDLPAQLRGRTLAGDYLLVRTRGDRLQLSLPREPAPIKIRAMVAPGSTAMIHSAALVCGGRTLADVSGLQADKERTLTLFIDSSRAPAGDCNLITESAGGQESFALRFLARP